MKLKQYVVFYRKGQDYKVFNFPTLSEGHFKFNELSFLNYDYLELAIDYFDSYYKIVRRLYNER